MPRFNLSLSMYIVLLLSFVFEIYAINAGQLGVRLNTGLADKGKYAYGVNAQFPDNILTDW